MVEVVHAKYENNDEACFNGNLSSLVDVGNRLKEFRVPRLLTRVHRIEQLALEIGERAGLERFLLIFRKGCRETALRTGRRFFGDQRQMLVSSLGVLRSFPEMLS